MEILETILTTVLVIVSILLILIILVQSNRSAGMGLFGGGASQTAFGSSSADVLTKITGGLAAVFLLITLGLAFIKSKVTDKDALQKKFTRDQQQQTEGAAGTDSADTKESTGDKTDGTPQKSEGEAEDAKTDSKEGDSQ